MASKAILSTTLNFGMVSAPVGVKKLSNDPKSDTARTNASPDGNGVKQVYRDEVTGAIYEPSELQKGIFDDPKAKVGFHPVPDAAIDAIEALTKIDGITIDGFVPRDDVPWHRVNGAYFLAPSAAPAVKPLVLLRDAMKTEAVVGIGKFTLKSEKEFIVYADGDALYLATLSWAKDCLPREEEAQATLAGVSADEKTLMLARTLIEAQRLDGTKVNDYVNESREQKSALIAEAAGGKVIEAPEVTEAPAAEVIDLEAALLASIGQAA